MVDFTMRFGILILLETSLMVSDCTICHEGTFLYTPLSGPDVCLPCEIGTGYMPEVSHTKRECLKCKQIQNPDVEVLKSACNVTHDGEILCKHGFYRKRARNVRQNDKCEKCFECEHPTRICEGYYDTVCCGGPNYDAVLNKDGVYVCKEREIFCHEGQFFDAAVRQCLVCPPDTYMSETTHRNMECIPCQKAEAYSGTEVLQVCNSTHPTVLGCGPGYFKRISDEVLRSNPDCVLCTKCQYEQYEARKCGLDHDAVCCNNFGVDSESGTLCAQVIVPSQESTTSADVKISCGEGKYLHTDSSGSSCKPCPAGTFMSYSNHTYQSCRNCSEGKCQILSYHTAMNDAGDNCSRYLYIAVLGVVSPLLIFYLFINFGCGKNVMNRYQDKKMYRVKCKHQLTTAMALYMFVSFLLIVSLPHKIIAIILIALLSFLLYILFFCGIYFCLKAQPFPSCTV